MRIFKKRREDACAVQSTSREISKSPFLFAAALEGGGVSAPVFAAACVIELAVDLPS